MIIDRSAVSLYIDVMERTAPAEATYPQLKRME
jgi:hypothetical protein